MAKILTRGQFRESDLAGTILTCGACRCVFEVEASDVVHKLPTRDFRGEPYGMMRGIACPECEHIEVVRHGG